MSMTGGDKPAAISFSMETHGFPLTLTASNAGGSVSATTTLTVAGYLTASGMATTADAAFNALSDADKWAKVATVRVCLIVRSENPVAPSSESAQYYNCSGTLTSAPDLRLRRAYTTTIVLRNRLGT